MQLANGLKFPKRLRTTRGMIGIISLTLLVVGVVSASFLSRRGERVVAPHSQSRSGSLSSAPQALRGEPPAIQPTVLADLTPDEARSSNALVPFIEGNPPLPAPFTYAGSPQDRAKALTCLSAAGLYEAGDDKAGEQAVIQVVLNRLRHPAFPKTVCGVVFQGSERPTGCQFTFTCDGSLVRPPGSEQWNRAEAIADAALSGFVDAKVGTATHYHTDWVVPYWRDSLTKLAKVGTQIFYRWPGAWGSARAFVGHPQEPEVVPDAILHLVTAPAADQSPLITASARETAPAAAPAPLEVSVPWIEHVKHKGATVRSMSPDQSQFVVELDPGAYPGSYALFSLALCSEMQRCVVTGWSPDDGAPASPPASSDRPHSPLFVYRRDRAAQIESAKWDCNRIQRNEPSQCI